MKVLCRLDPGGSYFVRTGWGKAFQLSGHDFRFHTAEKPVFDVFHDFEPDLYIGTTYDVDVALYKNILKRPNMRVILFASAWGDYVDNLDRNKYPIVYVTDREKQILEQLKKETGKPDYVFIHVTDKYLHATLGGWGEIGIPYHGILNAADILDYYPVSSRDEFKCDVAFCGGYWPYKSRNLNDKILPLCNKFNVKIFGNQQWPVANYLGSIDTPDVKHLFNSATVCPSVSESHSTDLGFDIVERPFKVMSSGGFCISDGVNEAREIFTSDELLMYDTAVDYKNAVEYFVNKPDQRIPYIKAGFKKVMSEHTYFDRVADMFWHLELFGDRDHVYEVKNKFINNNKEYYENRGLSL